MKYHLSQELPGHDAQERVRPTHNGVRVYNGRKPRADSRRGAVLALLFPSDDEFEIVFTKRLSTLKDHSGQISFPGGRIDPGETPTEAALRECWEETGVLVDPGQVLGELSQMYVVPSDFVVKPIVAGLSKKPVFTRSVEEVDEIFSVPLSHLSNPGNLQRETRLVKDIELDIPYYHWNDRKIWGATAAILTEFLETIKLSNV